MDKENYQLIIKETDGKDFPVQISRLLSKYTEDLTELHNKNHKITKNVLSATSFILNAIQEKVVDIFKEVITLRTSVDMALKTKSLLTEISERISSMPMQQSILNVEPQDFSIVVTPNENGKLDEVKNEIKDTFKIKRDLSAPTDIIATKSGQLILKLKSKKDQDAYVKVLKTDLIKDKVKIKTSRRGRERMLLLNLAEETTLDDVRSSLSHILESDDFEVVKLFKSKTGQMHCIIDVDMQGRLDLLNRKKICIDFQRVSVVPYVRITRCFGCQEYGHLRNVCKNAIVCSNCSGSHELKDCHSDVSTCINCTRANIDATNHRADSPVCMVFKDYRSKQTSPRL